MDIQTQTNRRIDCLANHYLPRTIDRSSHTPGRVHMHMHLLPCLRAHTHTGLGGPRGVGGPHRPPGWGQRAAGRDLQSACVAHYERIERSNRVGSAKAATSSPPVDHPHSPSPIYPTHCIVRWPRRTAWPKSPSTAPACATPSAPSRCASSRWRWRRRRTTRTWYVRACVRSKGETAGGSLCSWWLQLTNPSNHP